MPQATHRIRRVTWLVRTNGQSDGLRVRSALNSAWSNALAGEFEKTCDELAPSDVVLRIPRLELHVDSSSAANVGPELTALISAQLAQQLRIVQQNAQSNTTRNPSDARVTTAGVTAFDTLMAYLQTGALPWSAAGATSAETLDQLRSAARANLGDAVGRVAARANESVWFRLLQLLDNNNSELSAHLRLYGGSGWDAAIRDVLPALLGQQSVSKHISLRASAALCTIATGSIALDSSLKLLSEQLLHILASTATASASSLREAVRMVQQEQPAADGESIVDHPTATTPDIPEQASARLAVASAGLVLLHPFIATVLARTGIATANEIQHDDLPRAAALLHHLATGSTEVFEFELGLVKTLLGLTPQTELVVAQGLLSAADISESDAMIQAVIGHWSALGNTSVAALRSTFLARKGLLAMTDHGWTLDVEASSFDVLLNRLPWGFSIVRLPWMQRPLHTQWTL